MSLTRSIILTLLLIWWLTICVYVLTISLIIGYDLSYLTAWTWLLQLIFYGLALPSAVWSYTWLDTVVIFGLLPIANGAIWAAMWLSTFLTISNPVFVRYIYMDNLAIAILLDIFLHYLPPPAICAFLYIQRDVIRKQIHASGIYWIYGIWLVLAPALWLETYVLVIDASDRYYGIFTSAFFWYVGWTCAVLSNQFIIIV